MVIKLGAIWEKAREKFNSITTWEKIHRDKVFLVGLIAGCIFLLVLLAGLMNFVLQSGRGIRLINMDPSGEISQKTNLTFAFSGDIVPQSEVGKTFDGDLIDFSPDIPGKFRWISRRELRFLPEAPFLPSTRYKLKIKPNLVREKDRYLTGKRTLEFTTHPFKVQDVSMNFIYAPEQKKGLQVQARLSFNYPVSPVELQKFLKIRFLNWGKELKYNLTPQENSQYLTLTSEPIYKEDAERKVELVIPRGFCCVGGNMGLGQSYITTAVLGAKKPLTIIDATPNTDSEKCWITIRCSEPVEPQSISGFIQVKPELPFKAEVDGEYIVLRSDKFKSGESYQIRLAKGIPALNGLPLQREFSTMLFFKDLEPSLKFNSPGRYLSSKGFRNLGLETVNIERVNIQISQIYANNIVHYLNSGGYYGDGYYRSDIYRLGRVVRSDVISINGAKNATVTTPINIGQYLDGGFRGIFQVRVYDDDNRWRQDSKYVIVTDLGIVGKLGRDELVVWVNSLESLEPKAKVKVSLISRNNQIMAEEETDSQGVARFAGINKNTEGFESFIILAQTGDDFSFVHLSSSLISTVDFDVRGREHLVEGYEAFLYMDRDIFRPGEKGNLVAVLRGPNAMMPPEFPVRLELRQPDGQIFREMQSNTRDRGACEFSINIPDYAQTGKYNVNLYVAERVIGSTSFSVEEFMPERIKVSMQTDREEYSSGDSASVKVKGMNLFGPPAAGRRSELSVTLEPAPFTAKGFASYTFGNQESKFSAIDEKLGESTLDPNGEAAYNYTFPKKLAPPAKIRAIFHATVIEDGGRPVSSYKAVDFHPYQRYIGIKAPSEYYVETGKPYQIKYILVDKNGSPVNNPKLYAEVYRITWNSIYRRDADGRYRYQSEEEKTKVHTEKLRAQKGENSFQYTPQEYGRYQIVIKEENSESSALISFYSSGWGYSPWAMEEPDKIQMDLDKKVYRAGDKARVQIKAPFSGKALIAVEREKVYDYRIVDFKENTGVITIPVREEYKPNVYISVHMIRGIKSLEKHAPVRAFGTIPLMVDCSAHKITVNIDAASEIRPNREVTVSIKTDKAGDKAFLTLAAVDEGICQITNYNVPDPLEFFFGKRSLNIESYDLYGMILPEVETVKSMKSPGGDLDEMDKMRRQNLNPVAVRRVKPVSLWSGLIKIDAQGNAAVKLKVPQFNGTLRLMAVAFSGANFGSSQKRIIVRDPVVLTPTFPRFVAPNDEFTIPVSVFNGTNRAGDFRVTLKGEGPVEVLSGVEDVVSLKKKEEKQLFFQLKAKNTIGKLKFHLQVKGNDELCQMSEELSLRPAVPLVHEIKSGVSTSRRAYTFSLEDKWLPGTAEYSMVLAPFPALKFAGSLQYLLQYPYGCAEQTASKLFPLLYFDDIAKATQHEVFKGGNANYFIAEGIEKLESMQLRDGSFASWPGGTDSNDWASIYVSHFLVEARKAGYSVADRVYNRMFVNLRRMARYNESDEYHLQKRVYALYVLSLAGRPEMSTMAYLKNHMLDKLSSYSRAQLAAAYFCAGEREIARGMLPETFAESTIKRETGGNFNSAVRSDAIILGVLADLDPGNPIIHKLVERLSAAAKIGRWGTTQENAFALMSIGKILQKKSLDAYKGEVLVNGTRIASFDSKKELRLTDKRLGKGKVTVKITGGGECYCFVNVSGIPITNDIREYDHGISVRREYLDRHGNPVALNRIRQGDLIIARISVSTVQNNINNIGVVDMLPAGLEIENPRLGNNRNLSWIEGRTLNPDYLDIRDDRLIFFFSMPQQGTRSFYYALRAVTCGEFILPPVKAECMYEPELAGFSSSGQIIIRNESR